MDRARNEISSLESRCIKALWAYPRHAFTDVNSSIATVKKEKLIAGLLIISFNKSYICSINPLFNSYQLSKALSLLSVEHINRGRQLSMGYFFSATLNIFI